MSSPTPAQPASQTSGVDLSFVASIIDWLQANIMQIIGAFAVLVIGLLIAGLLSRWAERALAKHPRFDPTISGFLSKMVKYALWAVVLVTVLSQFGVETASILAALGGMALAVGLALQGTLSNVASGVMILVQRPFVVGEAISVDRFTATVQRIGLFTTELKQFDGLFVMVPNSELWNQPIINLHRHPTRRIELVVGIGYGDSMQQARETLLSLAKADERVLTDPEPQAFVASLDDSSVGVGLRVWCATGARAMPMWRAMSPASSAKCASAAIGRWWNTPCGSTTTA